MPLDKTGCLANDYRSDSYGILNDTATKERELNAFDKLWNYISGASFLLITNSEEADIEYDGIPINVVPAWKWLLRR